MSVLRLTLGRLPPTATAASNMIAKNQLISVSGIADLKLVSRISFGPISQRMQVPSNGILCNQQRNFSVFVNKKHNEINSWTTQQLSTNTTIIRTMTSQEITKNLQLFTQTPINVDKDPKTLKLKNPRDKPLVLMFAWLQAKQKHLQKYASLYVKQGYDVCVVSITPWQLMWPVKGTQIVAKDVVDFLNNNPAYNSILIHGFSVGGYMFGECLVHIAREMNKYQPLLNRFIGQIWDSAADITEIPVGVPKAVFPKNPSLQSALKKYMLYHLKTFHEPATSHYIRSSQMFHSNLVKVPALFLVSKTDPVGAEQSNLRVRENWESMGMKVYWKCWDRSPHVMHFYKHHEDYIDTMNKFLESLNLDCKVEKVRAKL